jgi:hypothetical protein
MTESYLGHTQFIFWPDVDCHDEFNLFSQPLEVNALPQQKSFSDVFDIFPFLVYDFVQTFAITHNFAQHKCHHILSNK